METALDVDTLNLSPTIQRLCRFLSERSQQPMVAVDGLTHIVVYINPAFARLIGRSRKDLIGRPFAEAVPEGAANGCLALLDRVYRTGTPELLAEQEHHQASPHPVFWSYSVWAILDESEQIAGVMIQITDATETANFRRQAVAMNESLLVSGLKQHELTETGRLLAAQMQAAVETRDRFLAVLSHELRNPLTALSTGLQVLKLARNDTSTSDSARDMMERQLKQMVRLVDDLLDISRIATGKLVLRKERVELGTVLRDALEASRPLIEQGSHELSVTLPPEPVELNVDPTRLGQVFLNLLNNAAKYSEPGGSIRVSARLDGGEVGVSVRDTGIGIPAADLPHVFDVFVQVDSSWQRAQGGLGIGLSLVKEFVGLHGGRVEAHSEGLGKGSEFIVRLPVTLEAASGVSPIAPTNQFHAPQRRILVVDDNRDAAESLAMLLAFLGQQVRTAYDGVAGVATAADFRPQLILMDIGMPGISGNDAARHIRAEPWGAEIFMVALTGWGTDADRKRTRDAGFNRHLVKPVDMDDLTKLLDELPIASSESK